MLKIEYEIKLNDNGRPYIDLAKDYENKPEDKFFVLEMSRYLLQNVYNRRSSEFDKITANIIRDSSSLLGQVSDEIAQMIYEQMVFMGDVAMNVDCTHHIKVDSIEERNSLSEHAIVYEDKIFKRQEGLKVKVFIGSYGFKSEYEIYELKGGITNEHWVKL